MRGRCATAGSIPWRCATRRSNRSGVTKGVLGMRKLPFHQLDVFSAVSSKGNPLAVIAEADGLDGKEMQAIANWTNVSETSFLSRPNDTAADYHVRIFTRDRE